MSKWEKCRPRKLDPAEETSEEIRAEWKEFIRRGCQQLGQTFGLGFKPDLCQIFTENPSEDCLFNYQRRDNSGSNGAGMGEGPDDLLTPLARHKRDRNEWRTRYRPPDRASVAYEANLWPVGLDAADYKANIFFRCFVLRVFSKCREAKTTEIQRWIEITRIDHFSRSLPFTIFFDTCSMLIDRGIFQSIIKYRFACVRWKRNIHSRIGINVKRFMLLRRLNFLPRKS